MSLRVTARPRIGPFRINTGRSGVTSVTIKLGPVSWRLWSRTGARGLSSVDLPGPLSYRRPARRPSAAERAAARRRAVPRRAAAVGLLAAGLLAVALLGAARWQVTILDLLLAAAVWGQEEKCPAPRRRVALVELPAAVLAAVAVVGAAHWVLAVLAVLVTVAAARYLHTCHTSRPTPGEEG